MSMKFIIWSLGVHHSLSPGIKPNRLKAGISELMLLDKARGTLIKKLLNIN